MTVQPIPWWRELRLRDELVEASGVVGDIQMSLRGAAYGSGGEYPPYRSVDYFGEITHPSPSMLRIAADVAVRVGGRGGQTAAAKPVWRFDQGMGGGKSHALVALWHMATDPSGFAGTDVGARVMAEAGKLIGGGAVDPNLGDPVVVALPGDQMDPDRADPEVFGGAGTLWERFLFRLYNGDHDRWVADKDTIGYADALRGVGRPVLVLFDEVMHYVRNTTAAGPTERAVKDQSFIIEMMRHTNEAPHCAAVMVMIDSARDPIALSPFGEQCRDELEAEAARGEVTTDAVTSPNDFANIIRRRLFKTAPQPDTVEALIRSFSAAMSDTRWNEHVFSRLPWSDSADFAAQVQRCYPFHPALMHLAEREWSQVAGFQRVRSTIRVFAATVYAHLRRIAAAEGLSVQAAQHNSDTLADTPGGTLVGTLADAPGGKAVGTLADAPGGKAWAPLLIGPGDVVLSDADVREALLDSGLIIDATTAQNYRQVIATDLVDEDDTSGNARAVDLAAGSDPCRAGNPRAAERVATAALLYSISDRPQGGQGGSVPEVLAASHTVDSSYEYGDAEVVLESLEDPQRGLASLELIHSKSGQPPRVYLSTKKTFGMFLRDAANAVSDAEKQDELRRRSKKLIVRGPFAAKLFVEHSHDTATPLETITAAPIDDNRKNRLVVLDPRVFSLLNGSDTETRDAIAAAMGIGDHKLAVNWASSAVYAVINTHRRRNALIAAGEYLAAQRVASRQAVKNDPDLQTQAADELERSRKDLDRQLQAAYQHVVWLADTGDGRRDWADHRFEGNLETALNGAHVWKVLEAADKAFGNGEFNAAALIHNLRERDYGKPLSELHDDFWRIPRLPLLPNGDKDLRNAIWEAVRNGDLTIVDSNGNPREARSPHDINLSSDIQRLAPKTPTQPEAAVSGGGGSVGIGGAAGVGAASDTGSAHGTGGSSAASGLSGLGGALGIGDTGGSGSAPGAGGSGSAPGTLGTGKSPTPAGEKRVAVAATLAVDTHNKDAVRVMLDALRNSVEDGTLSWMQLSLKATTTPEAADDINTKAEASGMHPTVTDL